MCVDRCIKRKSVAVSFDDAGGGFDLIYLKKKIWKLIQGFTNSRFLPHNKLPEMNRTCILFRFDDEISGISFCIESRPSAQLKCR